MFGPGMALRGKDGAESMHKAVENLKTESTTCFNFFILELFFFHISSFLLMWLYYSKQVAIVINIILAIFLAAFIQNGYDIYKKLYVTDEEAVSSKFNAFGFEEYDDLDKGRGGQNRAEEKYWNARRQHRGSDDMIPRQSMHRLEEEEKQDAEKQGTPFDKRRQVGLTDVYQRTNQGIVNAFTKVFMPERL